MQNKLVLANRFLEEGIFRRIGRILSEVGQTLLELRPPARNPLNFGPRAPAHLGQQFGEMSGDPSVLPMCSRLHFVVRLQFEIDMERDPADICVCDLFWPWPTLRAQE